jgi:oligosaccharyltransferase complex subunit beta
LKEIGAECGVEFSDEGTFVIDRFNSDVNDDGRNTLIISEAENLINNQVIAGNAKTGAPFLYRGVG